MVPCGLAGHKQCTVSVSSHTIHLRVVNLFSSSFLALNNFTEFFGFFVLQLLCIYSFILFIIIIICMNILLSIFVIECFIMPNRIFLYNEYSYLQPVLHVYACMYYERCS